MGRLSVGVEAWCWIIAILICLKMLGYITISWWFVLIPVWLPVVVVVFCALVIIGMFARRIKG